MNNEELIKVLADITKRLSILEDFMFKKDITNSFKNIYDDYLITYINDENIINLVDRDTTVVYNRYLDTRKKLGYSKDTASHIRSFNKAVRKRFPNLYIKHLTRNGVNVYIWKSNE